MNPLVISSLIGAGSSLLGGIFGGIGKGQERKWQSKEAEKAFKRETDWWKERRGYAQELKPSVRHETFQNLDIWNDMLQRAIMGSYAKAHGQEGMNIPNMANFLKKLIGERNIGGQQEPATGPMNMPSMKAPVNRTYKVPEVPGMFEEVINRRVSRGA